MYNSISINLEQLNDIIVDLSENGSTYLNLAEAKKRLDIIENLIEEDFQGDSFKVLRERASDIKDSERGISNNLEDFSKKIEKFTKRREDGITVVDEAINIRVDADIQSVNKDLKSIYQDIKGVINATHHS